MKGIEETCVNLFLGLVLDVVFVACLKAATRRRRPVATDDPFAVGPDKFSFPSGHASRAFFVATFFIALSPFHWIFYGPLVCYCLSTVGVIVLTDLFFNCSWLGLVPQPSRAC